RCAQKSALFAPASSQAWFFASGALLLFVALIVGHSLTRAPWHDEGVLADVAVSFRNHGHLGSSVLDRFGYLDWPQVDRYTYWQLPLYPTVLGIWFRFVPPNPLWMRLFSVAWAAVYIVCWFLIVRSLSRNESLALFVASVVALDYSVVSMASNGRPETLCSALGLAGVATFLSLKETSWTRAVVVAACFGAASLFCHPMGAITNAWIAAIIIWD